MKPDARHCLLWVLIAVVVYISCFLVNAGGAWYGGPAELYHLVATAVYALFWVLFTFNARHSGGMARCCLVLAVLTLLAAVTGLLTRSLELDILMIPARLLAPFSSVPMYGLRFFCGWTGLELVTILLSSGWLLYSRRIFHKE